MKKLSFILSFVVAIVGAFAFKPANSDAKELSPTNINLYKQAACTTPILCTPAGFIPCTDLYTNAGVCTTAYTGTEKRNTP